MREFEPFLPKVDPRKEWNTARKASRDGRKAQGGDYVIHMDESGGQQVLFMSFQDMPEDAEIGDDLAFSTSGPVLMGRDEEFKVSPKIRKEHGANRNSRPSGSIFVVRGVVYGASKVETDHVGNITIRLIKVSDCNVTELQFFDEVRPYVCLPDNGCDGLQ